MSLNGNIGVKYLGNIGKGKRNSDCAGWWCRGLWVPGKVFEGCLSPVGGLDGGCPGLFTTEGITAVKCGNNVRFLLRGPVWGTYCIAFHFFIFCT